MSTVVKDATAPAKRPSSRLARFLTSSIGLKLIMAGTGAILSAFVLGHMAGNLKVFEGAEAINAYGRLLRFEPALLWGARAVLLGSVILHIVAWVVLMRSNLEARPVGYRVTAHKESSFASRSMRLTGPLVLAFLVFHILHMTTGTVHSDFREGEVYHNLITGLSNGLIAGFYILALLALGFHLWHGVWSLFQTLGLGAKRYHSLGRYIATIFTIVVVGGFIAVPLTIVLRIIK
jgi:succinate dehydrogenase / fumarate reductase, cytochrome b subunit